MDSKAVQVVRNFLRTSVALLDLYSVPLAAAIVGWIAGDYFFGTSVAGVIRYCIQGFAALIFFVLSNRYLN